MEEGCLARTTKTRDAGVGVARRGRGEVDHVMWYLISACVQSTVPL